jgi:hypothetical protein
MKKQTKREIQFAVCINNKKTMLPSKWENFTGSFLMKRRRHTGIYASMTKVARTMGILVDLTEHNSHQPTYFPVCRVPLGSPGKSSS